MSKCFKEFPNHNLFICYDNTFCYINFMLSKYDNLYNLYDSLYDSLYNFIQFIYQKNHMY